MQIHQYLSTSVIFFCAALTANVGCADPAMNGATAAKSCAVSKDVKSCCQNATYNQSTEAKERKEAAICVKTINNKKVAKN
jgi:hypothetical protein